MPAASGPSRIPGHGKHPQRRAGADLDRPDLSRAPALGQGRRALGRLRDRGRRRLRRGRFTGRAQPRPLDHLLRGPLRHQHGRPAEDLIRRVALALAAGALLAAPGVAGCGGDDTNPAAVGTGASAGGAGTLSWALDRRPTTLDPLYARSAADLLAARQVDEPLIEELRAPFDETRTMPGLALSALPSRDDTIWRVRLRPGVRFQDGARFNASAVLANVDRWLGAPAGRRLLGDLLVD